MARHPGGRSCQAVLAVAAACVLAVVLAWVVAR